MAASGGYWISTPATTLWLTPAPDRFIGTGVITNENSLTDYVHTDGVQLPLADVSSRALPPKQMMQLSIEEIRSALSHVCCTSTPYQAQSSSLGHVWTNRGMSAKVTGWSTKRAFR
ncbi:MAG: hypothetical protein ACLRP3_00555 [Escherichia sp.]